MEQEDEHRIQDDIDDGSDEGGHHSQHGMPLGGDEIIHSHGKQGEKGAAGIDGKINVRVGKGRFARAEPAEQQILRQKKQHRQHGGQDQKQAEAVSEDALRVLFISLPQPHGKQNGAADPHQRRERGKQGDDGRADAGPGQGDRADLRNVPHIDAVHDAVEHVYELREHERHRYPQHQGRDAVLSEIISMFYFLLFHLLYRPLFLLRFSNRMARRQPQPDYRTPAQDKNQGQNRGKSAGIFLVFPSGGW